MVQSAATWNGKNKTKEARGVKALKAGAVTSKMVFAVIAAITLFVACSVLVVWTRNQVVGLGYQINSANSTLTQLREENRGLTDSHNEYVNLDRLQKDSAKLGLVKPRTDQVIVIYEQVRQKTD